MGEYAKLNGQSVKIGTCEQMYYLRADQVQLIEPERNSVNPKIKEHAEQIRFRFPFPQEDNEQPGGFYSLGYDYGMGLYGVEVPEEVEHHSLQFTRNYPSAGGILLSAPCPRSKEGKASGLKFHYNGYSGAAQIHSQRLVNGQLRLVMKCGDCGALWRCDSLEDCKDVLAALEKEAQQRDHETTIANARPGAIQCKSQGDFYREIARRIEAGYTQPNYWTPQYRSAERALVAA